MFQNVLLFVHSEHFIDNVIFRKLYVNVHLVLRILLLYYLCYADIYGSIETSELTL